MRSELPEAVLVERIIPIARGLTAESAQPLAEALEQGGITTIEITVENPAGFEAIHALASGPMTVGAGTITSLPEAQSAVSAGAEFLVSPHLDEDLVGWASVNGIPLIPGGFSPTEISRAWAMDVPAVKVFPVSVGGPDLIRSLLGPYPDLLLIPTGGVDAANAKDYLSAGGVAVGVGGWLTSHAEMTVVAERATLLRNQVV